MGRKSYPVDGLGQKIADKRFKLGLTLQEVSNMTGVDRGPLSRIERGGIIDPGFGLVVKLAEVLSLDLNYLAGKGKLAADRKGKGFVTFRQKYDRPLRRKIA